MAITEEARAVLLAAESSLRSLLAKGLEQQRYSDIADIAQLADAIARLIPMDMKPLKESEIRQAEGVAVVRPQAKGKKSYPRYERDGDRLVKIGWSKKNKQSYEHRAPRSAVVAFARHLADRTEIGEVFAMEKIFPVIASNDGDEVPGYQAYLALGWLRDVGLVEKKGRDGYRRLQEFDSASLDTFWGELPTKSI